MHTICVIKNHSALNSLLYLRYVFRAIHISFMQSASDKVPLKSLLYFCIFFFDSMDFLVSIVLPLALPTCFPATCAFFIPSLVI